MIYADCCRFERHDYVEHGAAFSASAADKMVAPAI